MDTAMHADGIARRRPGARATGARAAARAVVCVLALAAPLTAAAQAGGDLSPALSASPGGGGALGALRDLADRLSGDGGDEFLDPDVAFVPSAHGQPGGTVLVRWDIADGYYLYRKKFDFSLPEDARARLGEARMPPGVIKEDEFFGRMEVYYGSAEARVPVLREAGVPEAMALDVVYQGCADAGLCYPPITRTLQVSLPAGGAGASAAPAAPAAAAGAGGGTIAALGELSEQDRIARALAGDATWAVVASFFGFGLLLAFTPCVFPMVPILSGIIVGQGDRVTTARAFTLSLTYVLGMAVTYALAGVASGLLGQNLQAFFQSPMVLGVFSAVFVALALAMFGAWKLQLPAGWQARLAELSARQRGGTFAGVAVMGVLSALIVGPCVAAPLAGALIYIGQSGDGLLGGMALFAMSLGMGAPLLVIGTSAGKLLPRAGAWMERVRWVFGVLLLAVAVYLLERVVPAWVTLLAWAALLVLSAVYLGALERLPEHAGGARRAAKGAGVMMLLYGAVLMVGAASGGSDPLRPLAGLAAGGEAQALEFKRVEGVAELERELARAAASGRPVMLEYYADWCVSCKQLERYTFTDPAVRAVLADAVLLQTDVTENGAGDRALLERYGLYGPPAVLFFDAEGRERPAYRLVGYMNAERFRDHAREALG